MCDVRSWYHLAFCLFNVSFAFTFSGILVYRRLEVVGSKVLVRLDINLCAGLLSRNSVGVLHWSNRANHGSLLSLRAFLNKDLTIFTADSAFSLDLWWCREEDMWVNPQSTENWWNSWLVNWGALSVVSISGMPCRLNCFLKNSITELEVFSSNFCTSMKSTDGQEVHGFALGTFDS